MVSAKWYQFTQVDVQKASDPSIRKTLPAGIHYVTYDNFVSKPNGPPECTVHIPGETVKIECGVLAALCADGHARFVRDA